MFSSSYMRLVLSIALLHCLANIALCSTVSARKPVPLVPRDESPSPPYHITAPDSSQAAESDYVVAGDPRNDRRAEGGLARAEQTPSSYSTSLISRGWATSKILWTRAAKLFGRTGTSSSGSPSSGAMDPEGTSVSGGNSLYVIRKKQGAPLAKFTELVEEHEEGKGKFSSYFPAIDAYAYVAHLTAKNKAALKQHKDIIEGIWVDREVEAIPFTIRPIRDRDPEGKLSARTPESPIKTQNSSPLHLKRLSQAKLHLNRGLLDFMYKKEAGSGVFLYILGSGLRMDHKEFARGIPRHPPQEFYVPPDLAVIGSDRITDNLDHETCIASLAVGTSNGGAKLGTVIPVKFKEAVTKDRSVVPPRILTGGQTKVRTMFNVWDWTINDIIAKGRKGKAVINMSYGFEPQSMVDDEGHDIFDNLLKICWQHDIVTVVAAGNRPEYHLGEYTPQKLATPENPLIVVGGTTEDARIWETGTKNFENKMTLYAPAIGVTCASSRSSTFIEKHDGRDQHSLPGTSLSAGIVSGAAVYLLSLPPSSTSFAHNRGLHFPGHVSMNVKLELVNLSHPRRTNGQPGPNIVYNGVHDISLAQRKRDITGAEI